MNKYMLIEGGTHYDTVEAEDVDAAVKVACENFDASCYHDDELRATFWVDVRVVNADDREDHEKVTIRVDPPEPDCAPGESHDWKSPHEVLGGLKENPGVWAHGGGAIVKEVCRHCGRYRVTDTWAQRSDTGEQGLKSVAYEDADDFSEEWVAKKKKKVKS